MDNHTILGRRFLMVFAVMFITHQGWSMVATPTVAPTTAPSPAVSSSTFSLNVKEDERVYSPYNVFWPIVQDPQKNAQTTVLGNSPYSLAFEDLHKRTKEHFLVIPKGPYISFPHFMSYAKPEELADLIRTIAFVAEARGLEGTGYRIITNHAIYPGVAKNNHASQDVAHFHVHVAGGECLGKPVTALPFPNKKAQQKALVQLKKTILSMEKLIAKKKVTSIGMNPMDSGKKNEFKIDLVKPESNSSATFQVESPKNESGKADAPKVDPNKKIDPNKIELTKAEPNKIEPNKTEPKKIDSVDLSKVLRPLKHAYTELEKSIVLSDRSASSLAINNPAYLPGATKSKKELSLLIKRRILAQSTFVEQGKQRTIVAYRVPQYFKPIPQLIGFVLWDEKGKLLYQSFHDFAKKASVNEIYQFFRFIEHVAMSVGVYETGYRLISNHGLDAWQRPNVFQVFLAGGRPLGVTVTNVYGNRKKIPQGKVSQWEKSQVYYYQDLLEFPHFHCPITQTQAKKNQDLSLVNTGAAVLTQPKIK